MCFWDSKMAQQVNVPAKSENLSSFPWDPNGRRPVHTCCGMYAPTSMYTYTHIYAINKLSKQNKVYKLSKNKINK